MSISVVDFPPEATFMKRVQREKLEQTIRSAREYTAAVVFYHELVAKKLRTSVSDLKGLELIQRLGPRTAGELMAGTGLASSSVTAMIDRLQRRGLVKRTNSPLDRRKVLVELTPRFSQQFVPLFDPLSRRLGHRLSALSTADLEAVHAFLATAAKDVRIAIGDGPEVGGRHRKRLEPRA
jgi:DNA-binding MarR family transcriptional regulator